MIDTQSSNVFNFNVPDFKNIKSILNKKKNLVTSFTQTNNEINNSLENKELKYYLKSQIHDLNYISKNIMNYNLMKANNENYYIKKHNKLNNTIKNNKQNIMTNKDDISLYSGITNKFNNSSNLISFIVIESSLFLLY